MPRCSKRATWHEPIPLHAEYIAEGVLWVSHKACSALAAQQACFCIIQPCGCASAKHRLRVMGGGALEHQGSVQRVGTTPFQTKGHVLSCLICAHPDTVAGHGAGAAGAGQRRLGEAAGWHQLYMTCERATCVDIGRHAGGRSAGAPGAGAEGAGRNRGERRGRARVGAVLVRTAVHPPGLPAR